MYEYSRFGQKVSVLLVFPQVSLRLCSFLSENGYAFCVDFSHCLLLTLGKTLASRSDSYPYQAPEVFMRRRLKSNLITMYCINELCIQQVEASLRQFIHFYDRCVGAARL